jgi:hypothetical protein
MKRFDKKSLLSCIIFIVFCFHKTTLSYQHGSGFKADVMFPVTGKLVENFGWTTSFDQGRFNEGIYLEPKIKDSLILSPSNGKVVYLNEVKNKGKTIGIKSNGFFSIVAFPYVNSGIFNKKIGDTVKKGEKIGMIQNGKVLFEIRDFKGNPYDPIRVITHKKIDSSSKNKIYAAFKDILIRHGFKEHEIRNMFLIATMESGLNPSAVNYNRNDTVDIGLFQVNSVWHRKCGVKPIELYDVDTNIRCALLVLRTQGLDAWVSWKNYSKG